MKKSESKDDSSKTRQPRKNAKKLENFTRWLIWLTRHLQLDSKNLGLRESKLLILPARKPKLREKLSDLPSMIHLTGYIYGLTHKMIKYHLGMFFSQLRPAPWSLFPKHVKAATEAKSHIWSHSFRSNHYLRNSEINATGLGKWKRIRKGNTLL